MAMIGRLASTTVTIWSIVVFTRAAAAQTSSTPAPVNLDLGTVTATGTILAPSATGTQAQAIKQQQAAPNIVYVQPESVMRQLPDLNVAENLQHVPGISMQSDSGYGRFLVIRGLAEDLNATRYAGIDLPAVNTNANPTGGSRAVSLDFLPPGIIGGAQVIATLTPDMSATGLGGVVDLLPPTLPSGQDSMLNVTSAGGFTDLRHNGLFQGSIVGAQRFSIPGMASLPNPKPFTVIGSYGYINSSPGIFDVEEGYTNPTVDGSPPVLNTLQMRRYNNNRITQGYTGELDFDPDVQTHLFLRGMYSADVESIKKNELYLQNLDGSSGGSLIENGGDSFTATDANLNKFYANSAERVGMSFLEGGGQFVVGNLVTLNLHSAYAEGFDQFTRNYNSDFGSNNQNLTINYNTANPELRSYNILGPSGALYDPANPNNYSFSDLSNKPGHSTDRIYDNALNASVPTSFLDTIGTFKAGADFKLRSRGTLQDYTTGTPLNGPYSLADVTGGQPGESVYGIYPVGPDLNYGQLFNVPSGFAPDTQNNTLGFQHDRENIYAGFVQEDLHWQRLEALVGGRVEATDASYTAYGSATDASGNTVVDGSPTTKSQSYANFFPSVQLKYALTSALQARFAYSTGIARPGFQQINPALSITTGGGQGGRDLVSTGNPNLKPQTGNSFDLAIGYYTPHDGILEADLFLKNFSNYIVAVTNNTATTTSQTFENIGGATARGIQLEAIQRLYFLPAPLDGLGIDANLTYVDATAIVFPGQGRSILPETYPLTFNVAETYNKGPLSFELSEGYTSRNLFSIGSDPSTNVYTQPIFQMDMNVSYAITPRWKIFFQGNNLTNYKLEFTQSASSKFPIQREYYGQKFLFGANYALGS